jgi:protein ImuB
MFACLYVPDFSVQAALLSQTPEAREALRKSPIVVLDGPANLPKVIALNDPARTHGMEIGMTKLQVETCGGVLLRKRSIGDEHAAHARLIECANSFSPVVESSGPGTVLLDMAGTEKLFGPPKNVANALSALASDCGFRPNVAVASNPDTALFAARGFTGVTFIPRVQEAQHLACLKVDLLPATPEMLDILNGWGIYTFKAFGGLPEIALTERLGQQGLHLQKLARGEIKRTLFPPESTPSFVESHEFENPVETLEPLAFVLDHLLQKLCFSLTEQALSTTEVRLTLNLEVTQQLTGKNGESYERVWRLPAPTQDARMLLKLFRLELERNAFVAPVSKATIAALPIKPLTSQSNLFAPPTPEAGELEISLAEIRSVVGEIDANGRSCFGSPALIDTHEAGIFVVTRCTTFSDAEPSKAPSATTIALRRFRPPLAASVEFSGAMPSAVFLWEKYRNVLAASGPWCSSGNWWDAATSWAREEWDVALETYAGVGFFRIYLDRLRQQWFVEGLLD